MAICRDNFKLDNVNVIITNNSGNIIITDVNGNRSVIIDGKDVSDQYVGENIIINGKHGVKNNNEWTFTETKIYKDPKDYSELSKWIDKIRDEIETIDMSDKHRVSISWKLSHIYEELNNLAD